MAHFQILFFIKKKNTYDVSLLSFEYMNSICCLNVIMLSVNVWKYIHIHRYFMVFSVWQNLSMPAVNHLFSRKLLFMCISVQSYLGSFSFPYMEISNPVCIIAGIRQEMRFACPLGSVMWRRTACACLSHHLHNKFWKAIASATTLLLTERKRELGDGREAFLSTLLFILFPLDSRATW